MKTTCHSEYLPLQSVFINPAEHAFGSQIKLGLQWQELNYLNSPDFKEAIFEYSVFENTLKNYKINLLKFDQNDNVQIDAIYCRDASIATDFGMIICNMGKAGRINEPQMHKMHFESMDMDILGTIESPGSLEGGDVAWIDKNTLAVGYTYRTNQDGIEQLKSLLEPRGIEIIVADMPHYKGKTDVFHLMSIFSPIDHNLAVVYSPLMPIRFRNELLKRGFDFIEVPEQEFESMGCNVLALAPRKCLMVEGNPITKQRLESSGCEVITYKGEEISIKGGGGPTCLTRPYLRSYK